MSDAVLLEQRDALSRQILDLTAQDAPRKASAIEWLHSPEYGICELCGADIPYVRLLENPFEKICRHCRP